MRKLLVFVLLGLTSCFPARETNFRYIGFGVHPLGSYPCVSLDLYVPMELDSRRILVLENGYFLYLPRTLWLCSPSCLLKSYLDASFGFSERGTERLKISINAFYFERNGPQTRFILDAKCALCGKVCVNKHLYYAQDCLYDLSSCVKRALNSFSQDVKKLLEAGHAGKKGEGL